MLVRKALKWLSLLLVGVMIGSMFIGCAGDGEKGEVDADIPDRQDEDGEKEKDENQEEDKEEDKGEVGGKITDEPVKLTYWSGLSGHVSANYDGFGDTPIAKRLEELTGVEIEYIHPSNATEEFNLMVSTNEFPDIIERNFFGYSGGPGQAVEDGILIDLTDLIDEYAPNFKKLLESDPLIDKMSKTDDGQYCIFPFIRGHEINMTFYGPIMRKDWLDDLNLEVPTTIDEWYEVLQKFKVEKNCPAPFLANDITLMACGFDVIDGFHGNSEAFYLEDGEIKYGPMEPGYKEYLATMAKWYAEGLIHPDYDSLNTETRDAISMSDETGAFFRQAGSGIKKFSTEMAEIDPNYELIGVPYPSKEKGGAAFNGQKDFPVLHPCFGVTTACEEVEIAVQWLDFGYGGSGSGIGGEGYMLYNFGIEGESYEIVDGYPKYTEFITKNPDGLAMNYAMGGYMRSHYSGPMVQSKEYHEQYQDLPQQMEAIENWLKADNSHRVPPVTLTADENNRYGDIMGEISSYVSSMRTKFIKGEEPIEKYDEFVENIKKAGIDEALEIKTAAYKRFENR